MIDIPSLSLGAQAGTAKIFGAGRVGPYGIVASKDVLSLATVDSSAPVTWCHEDGETRVGRVHSLSFGVRDSVLAAHFSLLQKPTDFGTVFALPLLRISKIFCPSCGIVLHPGDYICDCQQHIKQFTIDKITIIGLKIVNFLVYSEIENKIRENIFAEQFSGAVSSISIPYSMMPGESSED